MSVVCIVAGSHDPVSAALAATAARGAGLAADGAQLTIITGGTPSASPTTPGSPRIIRVTDQPPGRVERIITTVLPSRLIAGLQRHALGRLVVSLLPADEARLFWRRVRRSPEAVEALSAASLVIACDPAAVRTAWFARHRLGAESAIIAG